MARASLKFLKKLLSKKTNNVTVTASETPPEELSPPPKSTKKCSPPPVEPPEECPICHDPVGLPNPEGIVESWTKLHCGHKFGTHCIQTWLQESINRDQTASPSCPICRTTAKHPCGHLISPPLFPNYTLHWQSPRPPPSPPRQWPRHRQVIRRRLTRRQGHPLRPPPEPRRRAQVVGECRTCAENAEFDARMTRIRERRRQHTGESATSTGSRSAAAIKAIIPGLKRSSHPVRTTVVHMGVDPHEERQPRGALCIGNTTHISSRGTRRHPTPPPPPSYSRRLSI